TIDNVTVDAHPIEQAIVIKYQVENSRNHRTTECQKLINLKDLNEDVDVQLLADVVMEKCALIPEGMRQEVEQILFYLQNRNKRAKTLIGALARVFREDWKKNFELATTIIRIFVQFSYYNQFQATLSHHKIGALCMNAIEYEIKRGDLWAAESKNADEKTARKCRLAIRKQQTLLAACITLLTNLAHDINVELKMVRRDIVPILLRCLSMRDSAELTLATVQFLLKLSIFEENKSAMEQGDIIGKLLQLFPIGDVELRKVTIRLLFNLSFDAKSRRRMVAEGLVTHVAPLIESDAKALNLLYQLSVNDDAKAMLTFTDAMQLLMRDLLTGNGSEATKAVLLNACAEKRNAQLVCGHDGQGLALLMDAAIDGRDLMVAKIVRSIASHEGPTQDMFVSSMPRLLEAGMKNALTQEDENIALGLEFIGTAALIKVADWSSLSTSYDLVNWIGERLKASGGENEPLQLQLVIMCGTMARQVDAARTLVPLLEVFLQLLHTMQEDDEFVAQLLYLFLQLLRHRELANRLMGPDSALGAYVIDLMHDKNPAIREMCDNALVIIGMGIAWLWESARHKQGERGLAASGACLCCVVVLAYCVSASHSIVLMSAMWISIFALCSLLSALYSMTITHKPMEKFSYGLARVPVLAVFSTTVLAQLFSIFLSKESFEHLLSPEHQGSHDAAAAHEHEVEVVGKHDFPWADPVCCLLLSVAVFSTMWPLSTYTGMILLQTAPPHLLNQIDRCISEASTIDGVLEIRSRHFWQLDFGQLVGTVDVRVRRDADEQNVLTLVTDKMSSVVSMLTVQIVKDAAWHTVEGTNPGHGHTYGDPHVHGDNHSHDHSHDQSAYGVAGYGNPASAQQGYSSPPVFSPSHGHSHDGVTYH
ncbi:cation efflux family protein, partial [Ostertagia ostertagi]